MIPGVLQCVTDIAERIYVVGGNTHYKANCGSRNLPQLAFFIGRFKGMATKTLKKKTTDKKVSNMTVKELKKLIKDTVLEVIDPDYGLELRPEVEKELLESMKRKEKGIPLKTVDIKSN